MHLMRSGSDIAACLIGTLALVAAGAGLYLGWLVSPYYLKNFEFKESMASRARIYGYSESRMGALREAIYRDAQARQIPLRLEDILVEYDPSGARVAADYTVVADLHYFQLPLHFHPQYPRPKEVFSPVQRVFLSALGFFLGLYWFVRGFGLFRKYKLIADTPLVPIRGVAMGRVQIHGKAVGEKTLLSPLSNQSCFLYKVDIERWRAGRYGSGRWSPYLTDVGSVHFCLEDGTGRISIDPREAELDLEESSRRELSKREVLLPGATWQWEEPASNPPGFSASDSDLRKYVTRVAEGMDTTLFQGADLPSPGSARKRPKKPSRGKGGLLGILAGLFPVINLAQIGDRRGAQPGDFRLTEYCVFPETEYDIAGTCAINPDAKNGLDSHVISRGQNDPTFLISNLPEKDLEKELHVRAWQHILGGGLLAVGGAAAFLETLGLLF